LRSIENVIPSVRRLGAFIKAKPEDRCAVCGGRGWKFRSFRQSVGSAGDAGEALLGRARVACLACTAPAEGRDSDD